MNTDMRILEKKETGIIMSGSHPVDILKGRKTMTRRVIKPQPPPTLLNPTLVSRDSASPSGYSFISDEYGEIQLKCPYGQVGDRLWVRETWYAEKKYDDLSPSEIPPASKIWYFADGLPLPLQCFGRKRSAMFILRWASRLTLEITGVRVERLQEISEADAIKEGIKPIYFTTGKQVDTLPQFKYLWDSLNAKRGYGGETNPWVWVISFEVIK